MSDEVGTASASLPSFSGGDIVHLFAGTYLPLCRTLHRAGQLDPAALSARILGRLGLERQAPWAVLAISLAHVLLADDDAPTA